MKPIQYCNFSKFYIALLIGILSRVNLHAQQNSGRYWNQDTQLVPWRMPLPVDAKKLKQVDLDNDGDPDLIYSFVHNEVPIVWIDDDDDMKPTDGEGDADSDCLLIDRNKDGIYAGPGDFSIDWCDENRDGVADIQVIVNNGSASVRNFFDWAAEIMYVMDDDKDNIMHFVDWNAITMLAWEHNGHANFYEDYHGNTSFIKMHASSFRINDLRYSWENPFLFYDSDGDNLSEMAIRFVNTPTFRNKQGSNPAFAPIDTAYDVHFNGKMDYVGLTWDLDNDNAAGNEFDFDLSILLKGEGFDYSNQKHRFNSLKGLGKQAEFLFFDKRWRQLDELIYPDRNQAWKLTFDKGKWKECSLVFDEDDDCNRWERVEFYEPKDLYKVGAGKGGVDNNPQADAIGDRGEFDTDFSGNGNLYMGAFDGKIHLVGAEWGTWRIDQTAFSFQGYGGIYDRWRGKGRMQTEPKQFAVIKYADTDLNGFIDKLWYDLDGDKMFEDSVSFKEIGVNDVHTTFTGKSQTIGKSQERFKKVIEKNWQRAKQAIQIAEKAGLPTHWYNFYKKPIGLHQKYDYGFWLNFYIYRDLRDHFNAVSNVAQLKKLDKAYYSGNWNLMD
ncbi:hypothetical protein [Dyadobacter diqingensis]|uniref:hypothetical protein n=1 Tax=Dyadobacter diqingensis TaxID=2938121 RepID=UPI0020C28A94|nr:hypothetical protein [Dyadobacter diqingensis]